MMCLFLCVHEIYNVLLTFKMFDVKIKLEINYQTKRFYNDLRMD